MTGAATSGWALGLISRKLRIYSGEAAFVPKGTAPVLLCTLAQLKGHRQALVDTKIEEHRGRIVKTTGDGMLVEFASVVDAIRCAVEVQRGMSERNARVSVDKRIEFRVGINLGDIIIDDDDI